MRRLVVESFGSLDDLVVVEAPDLEPAPGQVVVDGDGRTAGVLTESVRGGQAT